MKPHGPPSSSIRSPQFGAVRGAVLSDARIRHYMLLGYYGEAAKRRAQLEVLIAEATKKPRTRPKPVQSPALALIASLSNGNKT